MRPIAATTLTLALAACRDGEPPTAPPPPAAPRTAPSAPASALTATQASAMQARMAYEAQGTIDLPPWLARLVPRDLQCKPVERAQGRGMEKLRRSPGRRWGDLTLLTLAPRPDAEARLGTTLSALGFVAGAAGFANPGGEVVTVRAEEVQGEPLRLRLHASGPDPEPSPPLPAQSPEVALGLSALAPVGHEEALYHAVVPGGRVTDVSRLALLLRAKGPEARAKALKAWQEALPRAGYALREGRTDTWVRASTHELLVIVAPDDPSGDVLVSHQRRWRR